MIENFLFKPENELQRDIAFAMKLYSANQMTDSLMDRFFPTKRNKLEEQLLERQIAAMGDNPTQDDLNRSLEQATIAAKSAPGGAQTLRELLMRRAAEAPWSPLPKNVVKGNFKSIILKAAL